jgi:hypothetical protein
MIEAGDPLLTELLNCATQCDICYRACLEEKEAAHLIKCIGLDRECADLCRLTASLLVRGAERIDKYLKLCAEVCTACAEECEKHKHDHCQKCAHLCRSCAEACLTEKGV